MSDVERAAFELKYNDILPFIIHSRKCDENGKNPDLNLSEFEKKV